MGALRRRHCRGRSSRVGLTAHWEYNGNSAIHDGLTLDAVQDLNDDAWHDFRMESWTPTMIYTYLNGVQIWAFDISNPDSLDGQAFHKPYIFFSST